MSGLCALSQARFACDVMYDSSDEEDDPKEAAKKHGPAPTPPAAKGPRTQGDGPVDHVFSNDDLVAVVLSMIASRDTQKVDACRAATKLCSVNQTTETVCAAFPSVWRAWSRSIFEGPDADKRQRLLGEGLIYKTFYDDNDPMRSFRTMCKISAIANVTSKLFVLRICEIAYSNMWDRWYETAYENSGLDEEKWAKTTDEQRNAMARSSPRYPIDGFENMHKKVAAQLTESRLKPIFDEEAVQSQAFRDVFDLVFNTVIQLCFYSGERIDSSDADHFLRVATTIGDVLGTYIVCVTKLEKENRVAQNLKPPHMNEMDEGAFQSAVLEHVRTAHRDAPKEEMDNLLVMADMSGLLDGDPYDWNVEPTGKRIYLRDLKRRIVVAASHLVAGPGEPLNDVYSEGLDDVVPGDEDPYKALLEFEFADGYPDVNLAIWETQWYRKSK